MLTFIKLGGSLITDKRESQSFNAEIMKQAAHEIANAVRAGAKVLIGHGSGSFGHIAAQKYGTMQGVVTAEQWHGFAEVALVARRLNTLVLDTLFEVGLPVLMIQPSASAQSRNGIITGMETISIEAALQHGLVPVVYGDVSFDSIRGGTIISTETIFSYIAQKLHPDRIFLLGEAEGVYNTDGSIIPHINGASLESIANALGGSYGTDVTGGMASKVRSMVALAQSTPDLQVRIFGGTTPGHLEAALLGKITPGTLITA